MEKTEEEPRNVAPEHAAERETADEPARRDAWRTPAFMNPWARAFDADQLPDAAPVPRPGGHPTATGGTEPDAGDASISATRGGRERQ